MNKLLLGMATIAMGSVITTGLKAAEVIRYVPGEIIVKFKPGINAKSFFQNKSITSLGLAPKREIKLTYQSLNVLSVESDKSLQSALAILKNNSDVVYAEPNFIYSIAVMPKEKSAITKKLEKSPFVDLNTATPDDPSFGQLWGIRNTGSNEPQGKAGIEGADVNALKAWDITRGSHAVRIAIIDTGVDYTHPDLKGNVDSEHGFNFVNNTKDAMDDHGHGTHCAGTIGAIHDNKVGVAGVMAEVTIIPIKFLDSTGSGSLESAVKAIDYATELNVDLMSNSWGGGGRSEALFEAIKRASDKGIIFTAAAGNSTSNNDTTPSYPASYESPNVISVAALTAQNDLAYFSSYGRNSVHIAAPGHNILSTVKGGGYEIMSGTSMATPHVSGVLGLLLAKEGRLPHEVMKARLTMTGVPVTALRGKTQTASRIDAYNLLTDTRPERSGPQNDQWRTVKLDQAFESEHPYKENSAVKTVYQFHGAKYVRVKVEKFDLESGYDYVRIADRAGNTLEKVSGTGENYTTDFIEGDTVELNFVSDRSVNKWGFKIVAVEVQ
ncbi:MAG: S8 family serine peptidase [Bacteriovorax sp.]|nr:S8 family serine peptidase [Bacteriovorax sp.]